MPIAVRCGHCDEPFDAADGLGGGITNCPGCGRAVDVPGLRDPLWRGVQLGILVVALVTLASGLLAGAALEGVLGGILVLGLGWLATRAL